MKLRKRDVPKEIEVAPGIFYKILWKRDLLKEGLCGVTYFEPKEIHVAMKMSLKETMSTIAHEALHAMSHEHGFKIEHKTIYRMEEALSFFFTRNMVWIQWE